MFAVSDRAKRYQDDLLAFMDEQVYPAEAVYEEQMRASGDPHHQPAVIEELKTEAKKRGLWNLFHPHAEWGPGLTNLEYAPLAEIMGRSHLAPEATNCAAPDTGNMEVLHAVRHPRRTRRSGSSRCWTARSAPAFAMTEPAVASSDATNIEMRMDARRRRLRAQRPQVVRLQRDAQELQGADRHGQDRPGAPRRTVSSR